jgi:hypothetical protein
MEPGQETETPRRKGFWRRNWVALLAFASSLAVSTVNLDFFIPPRWGMGCFDGDLFLNVGPFTSSSGGGKIEWNGLQFGGKFYYSDDDGFVGIVIPIWAPLAVLATWIAFREWRRKRAAKGKPCRQ